jgi:flagellar motor switch protein FliN/FliY
MTARDDIANNLIDIPVEIVAMVGETKISIRELSNLNQGSIVELDKRYGDTVDLLVNGKKIGTGEVVVVGGKFGIRVVNLLINTKDK